MKITLLTILAYPTEPLTSPGPWEKNKNLVSEDGYPIHSILSYFVSPIKGITQESWVRQATDRTKLAKLKFKLNIKETKYELSITCLINYFLKNSETHT